MEEFNSSSLYFKSTSKGERKTFIFKFPSNCLDSIRWSPEDMSLLQEYDGSTRISDKLKQLAMIAKKVEDEQE